MSYTPRYDKGNWIADCDVCGRKYKAATLQQRWDGLMCCPDDWEIRQPQDFVRGIPDTQIAPWLRPEPNDSFIPVTINGWQLLNPITIFNSVTLIVYKCKQYFQTVTASTILSLAVISRIVNRGQRQVDGAPINSTALG